VVNTHIAYEHAVFGMRAPNAHKFNTFYTNIISIYTSLIYVDFNRDMTGRITRAGCENHQVKSIIYLAACYLLVWRAVEGTDGSGDDDRVSE
jgi:hypothetical protein